MTTLEENVIFRICLQLQFSPCSLKNIDSQVDEKKESERERLFFFSFSLSIWAFLFPQLVLTCWLESSAAFFNPLKWVTHQAHHFLLTLVATCGWQKLSRRMGTAWIVNEFCFCCINLSSEQLGWLATTRLQPWKALHPQTTKPPWALKTTNYVVNIVRWSFHDCAFMPVHGPSENNKIKVRERGILLLVLTS